MLQPTGMLKYSEIDFLFNQTSDECFLSSPDKYAFFLVSTSSAGPQIYELVTKSKSDREVWMKRILSAQEKKRPSRRGGKVATVPTVTEEEDDIKSM